MDGEFLARLPLFESLPRIDLDRLATKMRAIDLSPGTVLFREGEPGDSFYIVFEGQVTVFRSMDDGEERILAVRGAGEFIGEMSLLNKDGVRTASVRAREPARLWEIAHSQFDDLIRSQPELAYEMARILSARMTASMDLTIQDLQRKNAELAQAYQDLKAAQAQIIEKEKLERELQLAHDIQMSILPQDLPQLAGYDFGARIVPARAVGGDFYDVASLGDQKVGIVVGDVSGKGVPAAIYMAQTHALIHVTADLISTPAEVLRRVNRQLVTMGTPSLWVTVLYGVLDTTSGQFSYARAGHELPLVGVDGGEVKPAPLGVGQPLGLLDEPAIEERTMSIPPGGQLLLYSDGFVDAQDSDGREFGRERLLQSFARAVALPAQEVCDVLWQALKDHQGDCDQFDDVTLVSVRSVGSKS
jgi:sigma-B regulation protein RsbU (phosphoserine phosphatase)